MVGWYPFWLSVDTGEPKYTAETNIKLSIIMKNKLAIFNSLQEGVTNSAYSDIVATPSPLCATV